MPKKCECGSELFEVDAVERSREVLDGDMNCVGTVESGIEKEYWFDCRVSCHECGHKFKNWRETPDAN